MSRGLGDVYMSLEQLHGHFGAEISWTIGPTILMAAIAIFSVGFLLNLDDVDAAPDGATYPDVEVLVVGQQWWWEYHYYLDGIEGADRPDFDDFWRSLGTIWMIFWATVQTLKFQ